jgi:MFS family permease
MLIINFSHTYPHLIAAMMIYGIGIGLMMPNNTLWIMSLSRAKNRSVFLGIFTTSTYFGKFLSPIILYPFLKYINIKYAFFCGGAISIATSISAMYLDDYFRRVNIAEFKKRLKFKYLNKKLT